MSRRQHRDLAEKLANIREAAKAGLTEKQAKEVYGYSLASDRSNLRNSIRAGKWFPQKANFPKKNLRTVVVRNGEIVEPVLFHKETGQPYRNPKLPPVGTFYNGVVPMNEEEIESLTPEQREKLTVSETAFLDDEGNIVDFDSAFEELVPVLEAGKRGRTAGINITGMDEAAVMNALKTAQEKAAARIAAYKAKQTTMP